MHHNHLMFHIFLLSYLLIQNHRHHSYSLSYGLFQFTPLREGRRNETQERRRHCDFNSRPSARGDFPSIHLQLTYCISIHAPPRGATPSLLFCHRRDVHFNSRPSARGDRALFRWSLPRIRFQFTPLREGRQVGRAVPVTPSAISIHAPPRGATPVPRVQSANTSNFNSRPSARGDMPSKPAAPAPSNFNSRPSARGDNRYQVGEIIQMISIHAPPRGATARQDGGGSRRNDFNSRPSARGDARGWERKRWKTSFQFTPLREGRLLHLLLIHPN